MKNLYFIRLNQEFYALYCYIRGIVIQEKVTWCTHNEDGTTIYGIQDNNFKKTLSENFLSALLL